MINFKKRRSDIVFKYYKELNVYLNDVCIYLEKEEPYLIRYIYEILKLNNLVYPLVRDCDVSRKEEEGNIDFRTVYNTAREVIESINKSYLEAYDKILLNGELEFSYQHDFHDSHVTTMRENGVYQKVININRSFDYSEVVTLVHEFIHYTTSHDFSFNRTFLSEFLAIYFEMMAIDYLKKKGITGNDLDYSDRLNILRGRSNRFYGYGVVLFAYLKFGNLNADTYKYVNILFPKMTWKEFKRHCAYLYSNFLRIEMDMKNRIDKDESNKGQILAEGFMTSDYLYVIGTVLAIFARRYCDFADIIALNDNMTYFDYFDIEDVLLRIGINIHDEEFLDKITTMLSSYIEEVKALSSLEKIELKLENK